ncbi:MAG TPA: IclR family transcriptional regulator [Candidatus Eremiobacteraceae bacterium]|nr:IclR family transcriptional regulator [Candidatus Eremiobacteraceae bacterium]
MFLPENGHADRQNGHVPAVAKAFRLLDLLSTSPEPLGVSELSRRLGMGKSTIHGLVTTLRSFGAVEPVDGAKRYRIGRGLHALAMRSAGRVDLRSIARPSLERLAAQTEQSSFLGVVADDHVTILDLVHGKPAMSVSAPVGSTIPLLAGAVGKAVLSAWDPARRADFLHAKPLPKFTLKTVADPAAYEEAVQQTIARGVALDVDEYVDGMRAAAAPVLDASGQLAAVIWIAAFARHIDDAALADAAVAVSREAHEIARSL